METDHLQNDLFLSDGSKIEIFNFINKGVYGEVYKVQYKEKIYAMKIFKQFEDNGVQLWEKEKNLMLQYKRDEHPNDHWLIRLFRGSELSEAPPGMTKFLLLMDLMGPTVYDVMQTGKTRDGGDESLCGFTNDNIKSIMKQVCSAMEYLHELEVLHLDLKPENIFFKNLDAKPVSYETAGNMTVMKMEDTNIRVGDVGCGEMKKDVKTGNSVAQTQNYRAPEVFLGLPYDEKVDVWSFGCVVAEMYTGEVLFFGNDDETSEESQLDVIQCTLRSSIPYSMFEAAYKIKSDEVIMHKGVLCYREPNTNPIPVKQLTACIRPGDSDAINLFEFMLKALEINPRNRPSFAELTKELKFY